MKVQEKGRGASGRICELCGHANAAAATACGVCGNEIPVAVLPVAERIAWVCDSCDAWNQERSVRCSYCGERLDGEVRDEGTVAGATASRTQAERVDEEETTHSAVVPDPEAEAPPTVATKAVDRLQPVQTRDPDSGTQTSLDPRVCAACGTPAIPNHRFCGNCGAPHAKPSAAEAIPEARANPVSSAAVRAPSPTRRAELVLVQSDGADGARFEVGTTPQITGRTEGSILFPDDRLLSGRHASLVVDGGMLLVQDLESANGTFIRLSAPHPLRGGDVILLGEQLLLFRQPVVVSPVLPDAAGTVPYVSAVASAAFHLVQILAGGRAGAVFTPTSKSVTLGREASDICFSSDRFMSSRHARIESTAEGFQIVDLHSRNGTYMRIRGRAAVQPGETVFLGQQLFRFELNAN